MKKIKCDHHKKQQAFYYMDSWTKGDPVRKLCCICVDGLITKIPNVKKTLNIRLINEDTKED